MCLWWVRGRRRIKQRQAISAICCCLLLPPPLPLGLPFCPAHSPARRPPPAAAVHQAEHDDPDAAFEPLQRVSARASSIQ